MHTKTKWGVFFSLLAVSLAIVVIGLESIPIIFHAPLDHVDGAYQTFSGLDRLNNGDVIGRDFASYLGVGVLFIIYPFFKILGGNLAASQLASHFLCHLSFFCAFIWLSYLAFGRFRSFINAAILATLLFFLFRSGYLNIEAFHQTYNHGGSILALRTFIPFIVSFLIFIFEPKITASKKIVFFASILGVAPLWSNDYGYPTLLAGFVFFLIPEIFKTRRIVDWISKTLLAIFFISASFFTVLCLVTQFHPVSYLEDAFGGFAHDQFWFFGPYDRFSKYFYLVDIFTFLKNSWLISLGIISLIILLFQKDKTAKHVLFIIAASIGAALLSEIGGHHADWRYWAGAIRCVPFATICLFTTIVGRQFIVRWEDIHPIFSFVLRTLTRPIAGYLVLCLLAVYLIPSRIKDIRKTSNIAKKDSVYIEEIGSYIPASIVPSVVYAREKLSGKKVLSEYVNYMLAVSRTGHLARVDAIIHALGDKLRANFESKLDEADYVLTSNPQGLGAGFNQWTSWNTHINWPFYRKVVAHFEVSEYFDTLIVWKRKKNPVVDISSNKTSASCEIEIKKKNEFQFIFKANSAKNNQLYEMNLCFDTSFSHRKWYDRLVFKDRIGLYINTYEVHAWRGSYGVNPEKKCIDIPVMPGTGEWSISYNMVAEPAHDVYLKPKSCSARYLSHVEQKAFLSESNYFIRKNWDMNSFESGKIPVDPYNDGNFFLGVTRNDKKKIRIFYSENIWKYIIRRIDKKISIYGQERILKNFSWDSKSHFMYLYVDYPIDMAGISAYAKNN